MPDHMPKLDDDDFGFSFTTTEELTPVDKAQGIYNMILPLLNNLMANPEKEYIHWPDRVKKIEAFKAKLKKYIEQ
jgi:hypothetical protein